MTDLLFRGQKLVVLLLLLGGVLEQLRYDGAAHRCVDLLGRAGQDRIVSRKQMFKTPANVCKPAANVQILLHLLRSSCNVKRLASGSHFWWL